MTERRDFLRLSLLSAGGFMLSNKLLPTPTLPPSSWAEVRKLFPLASDLHFLNNGTMGVCPYSVLEAMQLSELKTATTAQYGGWQNVEADIAKFTNAKPDEICLTHNVTEGINIVAQGLVFKKGQEMIISNHEHVGGALPWLARAKQEDLSVKILDLNLSDADLLEQLNGLITKKTKIVALPHVTCTTGRVLPITAIAKLCKSRGVLYLVDGAHGAGMQLLDFEKIEADFYASCFHKWMLGPQGNGFLWINEESLEQVHPRFVGAYSDTGWTALTHLKPAINGWQAKASRFYYGTQSLSHAEGIKAAIHFYQNLGSQNIRNRIYELQNQLYQQIKTIDDVELLTPENQGCGMLSFQFKNLNYEGFFQACKSKNIIIRMVPENQVNAIRVSCHIYNNEADLAAFLEALNQFIKA